MENQNNTSVSHAKLSRVQSEVKYEVPDNTFSEKSISPEICNIKTTQGSEDHKHEQDTEEEEPKEPFSIFSDHEKYFIALVASFLALFSSISVPIYLPVLPELETYFNVTTEQINMSVVAYSIFQGLAPALWGPLADKYGRRPIFPLCVLTYIAANIALARTTNYAMLIAFRCLQAAGIAAAVAIGSGIVGDVSTRKDRGTFMGLFGGLTLVGNALGPLIGAGLASGFDWRGIFWFLVIAAACALITLLLFMPETNRTFVGNGSVRPKRIVNRSPYMRLMHNKQLIDYEEAEREGKGMLLPPKHSSYLRTFSFLLYKDVVLILIPAGLHYSAWFTVITVQSTALTDTYGFTTIQLGLSYLANGIGSIVGSLGGGKVMNMYYQSRLKAFNKKWIEEHGPDSKPDIFQFNIAAARLAPILYLSPIMIAACLVFGWGIEKHIHWAVPVVMTLFVSLCGVLLVNISGTLMIDYFPQESSAATATVNLVRCSLCVIFLATIDKMIQRMGTGWAITLVCMIVLVSNVGLLVEYRYGNEWYKERMRGSTDDSLFQ